jgi:hypothetical protein
MLPCIVVRRGDYQQYDRLYRAFGDRVPVVWDRRRTASPVSSVGARQLERRHAPPASWVALGFVVVDRPTASRADQPTESGGTSV